MLKEIVTGDETCSWGLYLSLASTHALPFTSCLPGSETESLCQALMATAFCSKTSLETEPRDPRLSPLNLGVGINLSFLRLCSSDICS